MENNIIKIARVSNYVFNGDSESMCFLYTDEGFRYDLIELSFHDHPDKAIIADLLRSEDIGNYLIARAIIDNENVNENNEL